MEKEQSLKELEQDIKKLNHQRMRNSITENEIEAIALSYLQYLGYSYILGTTLSPDGEQPERQYNDVVLATRLREAIDKLNPTIAQDAKEDALKKYCVPKAPLL